MADVNLKGVDLGALVQQEEPDSSDGSESMLASQPLKLRVRGRTSFNGTIRDVEPAVDKGENGGRRSTDGAAPAEPGHAAGGGKSADEEGLLKVGQLLEGEVSVDNLRLNQLVLAPMLKGTVQLHPDKLQVRELGALAIRTGFCVPYSHLSWALQRCDW